MKKKITLKKFLALLLLTAIILVVFYGDLALTRLLMYWTVDILNCSVNDFIKLMSIPLTLFFLLTVLYLAICHYDAKQIAQLKKKLAALEGEGQTQEESSEV